MRQYQLHNMNLLKEIRLWIFLLGFGLLFSSQASYAQAVQGCGSLDNAYGPWDYSNTVHRRDKLPIVEVAHYDAGVAALRGHVRKPNQLRGDIDYTLRAFPNHHKALHTMLKYYVSDDPRHRRPLPYSADCYFKRAIVNQPNDPVVRLLYGIYKSKVDDYESAKKMFLEAEQLSTGSPELYYNIGLVMAKNGEYDDAYPYAVKAYDLGYPLPGLKNILRRAGKWPESSDR